MVLLIYSALDLVNDFEIYIVVPANPIPVVHHSSLFQCLPGVCEPKATMFVLSCLGFFDVCIVLRLLAWFKSSSLNHHDEG